MIRIDTYLKCGSRFVRLEEAERRMISDPDYIEGAVQWTINGTRLLTAEEWDYVDQFWSYWIQEVKIGIETGYSSFSLPDQPIRVEMKFDVQCNNLDVKVLWLSIVRNASVELSKFISVFTTTARDVNNHFRRLDPRGRSGYDALDVMVDEVANCCQWG